MKVQNQVTIIFAGANGFLDEIPIKKVLTYETEMLAWMDRTHPEYLREIAEKKVISDDLEAKLIQALKDYGKEFTQSHLS